MHLVLFRYKLQQRTSLYLYNQQNRHLVYFGTRVFVQLEFFFFLFLNILMSQSPKTREENQLDLVPFTGLQQVC